MIILLLTAYQIAVIVRILIDFFTPEGDDNTLVRFLYIITEPGLILCEMLLSLVGLRSIGPIDMTVTVSLIIAAIIKMTLQALI
jgi:uncharacterized protein YggT (Ycf19 family)